MFQDVEGSRPEVHGIGKATQEVTDAHYKLNTVFSDFIFTLRFFVDGKVFFQAAVFEVGRFRSDFS